MMKFSILKESLLPYVNYANSFTSPKTMNTFLQNIYIEVTNEHLIIRSTNYQMGFSCEIPVDVIETGVLTVSGKKLLDIVKELPDASIIDFSFDGSRLIIKSGRSLFKLSTMSADGFPTMTAVSNEYSFNIDSGQLLTLLKRIAFCISNESQKLEYTGAQFNLFGNTLELYATSIQRVAISTCSFESKLSDEFIFNVPKRTVQEVVRIFEGLGNIEIVTDRRQISFKSNGIIIYSKLIEKFVKGIRRLFSNDYPIKATLDRRIFLDVLKRVSSITSDDTPGIVLSFEKGRLTMSSIETEYGQGVEVIDDINFNSENFEIILNSKHLHEILSIIDTDTFTLEMRDNRSPSLITPDNADYQYLVVPISIDKV